MANKLKGVGPQTPVGKAMRRALPPRVEEILRLEPGVREGDVEGLHDIRVATKRLREAARLFTPAFGKRRMKSHLEHLEHLNDTLGHARELDVLILHLEDLAARDADLGAGLAPLLATLSAQRAEADGQLMPVLDETLPFLEQDFVELLADRSKGRKDVWKMPFIQLARDSVTERVTAAFDMEPAARPPEAVEEFHRMRIAIKKVKYALELYLDVLDKRARKAYKPISRLQDIMGEVHDCDVLLNVLAEPPTPDLATEVTQQATALVTADRAALHADTLTLLDEIHAKKRPEKLLKACLARK